MEIEECMEEIEIASKKLAALTDIMESWEKAAPPGEETARETIVKGFVPIAGSAVLGKIAEILMKYFDLSSKDAPKTEK